LRRGPTPWRNGRRRDGFAERTVVSAPGRIFTYGSCFVKRTYRIVVAKPGLDGHDRGAKTITRALRDHGFEVIYTGLHQTPEQIAETVLQEDADGVGLSLLSGAHLTLFPRVMQELRDRDLGDVLIFGGGVIPDADARELRSQGVAEIFGPGSSLKAIGAWLEQTLDQRESD
jgi:methylmalonyl-CoA mutase, C-terminal domain